MGIDSSIKNRVFLLYQIHIFKSRLASSLLYCIWTQLEWSLDGHKNKTKDFMGLCPC